MDLWNYFINGMPWFLAIVTPVILASLGKIYLEKYKNDLIKKLDEGRHALDRSLEEHKARFGFYAEKKAEQIINLYEKMYYAHGSTMWLNNPLRKLPDYSIFTDDEIMAELEKHPISKAYKNEILTTWKRDQNAGSREFYKLHRQFEENEARKALHQLYSSILSIGLFIQKPLQEKVEEFRIILFQLLNLLEFEYIQELRVEGREQVKQNREEINNKIVMADKLYNELIEDLKEELINKTN